MIPSAFIGSSKESLGVARKLSQFLESSIDCTIWDEGFFSQNDSAFDVLLKKSALYDAGIILLTKDDTSLIRRKKKVTPRDNTIFEAGLFYGRLGKGRTFLVVEKGVTLPSDISGITIVYFKKGKCKPQESLETGTDIIARSIQQSFSRHHFGLLPSTALALGYFSNFIKPMANEIAKNGKVKSSDMEKEYCIKRLSVHIPHDITLDVRSLIATHVRLYQWHEGQVLRDGKRNFNVTFEINRGKAIVHDIPSTLSVVGLVVDKLFSDGTVGVDNNITIATKRELENFEHAIRDLVQNDASVRLYVSIEANTRPLISHPTNRKHAQISQ